MPEVGKDADVPGRYRERPYVPARDPLSAIPPSRHPFQFWMMAALALAGGGNLFRESQSAINELLPPMMIKVWAATMLIGGVLAIVAAFWHDRITGLLLERIALSSVAFSCIIYGTAVYTVVGWAAFVPGSLITGTALACIWRIAHVTRELKVLRQFISRNYR